MIFTALDDLSADETPNLFIKFLILSLSETNGNRIAKTRKIVLKSPVNTDNKTEIQNKMNEFAKLRREKQPLEYPSAGSTFKRPEGYFAGKLIQEAQLRGVCVGDAQVSDKHCGFVINRGGAQAADIYDLINEVIERVEEVHGVTLEPEVKLIGDFA